MRLRLAIALGCIPAALAIVGAVLMYQSAQVREAAEHAELELGLIMNLGKRLNDDVQQIQILLWQERVEHNTEIDELITLTEDADAAVARLRGIKDVQPAADVLDRIQKELDEFKRLTSAAVTLKDEAERARHLSGLAERSDRIRDRIRDLEEYTNRHRDEEIGHTHQASRLFLALVMGGLAGLLVLSAGVAVNIVRGVSRPVTRLLDATKQLSRRNFAYRADEALPGEFGDLARGFNQMAGELSRAEELRLQAVRELVVTVDHEVRNSLAAIVGATEVIRKNGAADPDTARELGDEIVRQVRHVRQVLVELEKLEKLTSVEYARGIRMLRLGDPDAGSSS